MFLLDRAIFPWDFAILLLVAGSLALLAAAAVRLRRPGLSLIPRLGVRCAGLLSFLVLVTVLYGSFVEPRILVTDTYRVPLPLHQPLTIAVISDMHVGPYVGAPFLESAVAAINRQLPDIVVLDGDFLFDASSSLADLSPLAALRPSLGTFAVYGNHDAGRFQSIFGGRYDVANRTEEIGGKLRSMGITVLRNTNKVIRTSNDAFAVAGTGDLWAKDVNLPASFRGIPDGMPVILFSHNPDVTLDPQSRRAALIISAHTHGGQFRLPFDGPIAPVPTKLGPAFSQGVFALSSKTTLAVTRGIGETMARARLFAWPEVMVLKTQPK
jgi:predicted MPP superfamily phosphohydrolase